VASAKQLRSVPAQIKALAEYTRFLHNEMRYKDALTSAGQQLQLSLKIRDYKSAANAYNNIGIQYRILGDMNRAADNILKALNVSENINDPQNKRRYYTNLASIFLDLNDTKQGLYYAQKSYDIATALKDSLLIAYSINNLSVAEVYLKQYDKAIAHIKQQVKIAKANADTMLLLNALVNMGDAYNHKSLFKEAYKYYMEAGSITKQSPVIEYDIYIDFGLANCYTGFKNLKMAEFYLNRSLIKATTLMPKNDLKEVYILGAEIHEKLKQPDIALQYYKKYSKLNDSIINANTQNAIHVAEIKYNTSVKEKAIAQQKLQIADKNLQLQAKNRFLLLGTIAIVLLIFICAIIYLIYRNKNQAIELSLLKAQIHPHFLFNTLNNLYALSMDKSDESPGVVLGLAQILRYILYECNTPHVNLQKEIEIIKRYIDLEKIRYNSNLEVNLNIQGDLASYKIAPLLILPLVENAFKHGISKLTDEGWINIETSMELTQFTFKISNNKPLLSEEEKTPSKYGNIGLINIKKRLSILYPQKHELEIINEDEVFIVIMSIDLTGSHDLGRFKRLRKLPVL
jgi:tetratricopeptide (TPR) repeat protein